MPCALLAGRPICWRASLVFSGTRLTGITQAVVDNASTLDAVLERFRLWLDERGLVSALEAGTAVFVAHGGWDLVDQLPKECARKGLTLPSFYGTFADLKVLFALSCPEHRGTSLKQMLDLLGLPQVRGAPDTLRQTTSPPLPPHLLYSLPTYPLTHARVLARSRVSSSLAVSTQASTTAATLRASSPACSRSMPTSRPRTRSVLASCVGTGRADGLAIGTAARAEPLPSPLVPIATGVASRAWTLRSVRRPRRPVRPRRPPRRASVPRGALATGTAPRAKPTSSRPRQSASGACCRAPSMPTPRRRAAAAAAVTAADGSLRGAPVTGTVPTRAAVL